MSDALPEDLWVNNFLSSPPRPLQTALQKRLQTSTNHLNLLAELYKQRAIVESQYAESLSKLVRQAEQGNLISKSGSIDWDKASGEAKLWDSVIGEISETSTSHSTLAALLRTDFEQPLRELPSKIVSWRRISDQDASLEKTLKDYEKTSTKLEKASSKSKSSKADQLSSELNDLTSSLASLSPMVYSTYQRLDEERLRGLKELVVRWGTVRADMAQRDGECAERVVALLVSWESQEEVAAVGRKLGGGRGGATTAPTLNSTASSLVDRRTSIATQTSANDFSPRPTPRQNGSTATANAPSSFAGGLKSMLGRKPTLGTSRGRSGSYANSTRSAATDREENLDEPVNRAGLSTPLVDDEGFSVAPADRHRSPWDEPEDNIPTPTLAPSAPAQTGGSFGQNFTSSPTASNEALSSSPPMTAATAPKLNLALATAPIEESEADREAALQKMQQTLQLQPPQQPSRRQTIARGRRDVRNTMFGSPVEENAGNVVARPLSSAPIVASPIGNSFPTPKGRQTSVSSVASSNPFDSPGLGAGLPSSFAIQGGSGLRASMIESINAITKNGQVSKLQINGEIHLSLRPQNPVSGPIHIRLSDFEKLEKIAPNPAYLAQVPDKPGEYFLNAEVLSTATISSPPRGTLLFRYQVHIPVGEEQVALPLIIEPAFRCADGETRMILNYKRNAAIAENLTNLELAASFKPGPVVSSVQAKPAGGTWSPNSRRMTWTLGSVSEGKIIAKFVSEAGEALSPIGVQASWSIEGRLSSGIGLSVVKGDLEADVDFEEVQKAITTGKYLAEAVIQ